MANMKTRDPSKWMEHNALDRDGAKLGKVADVYVDDASGTPQWLALRTGLFGGRISFVPLEGATERGDDVIVAYDKDTVKAAPNIEADGQLTPAEERVLFRHYGWDYDDATSRAAKGPADRTGRGGDGGSAMTRSEEEVAIDKRTRVGGRARLRKWVETEDVDVTVPVRREKARLVTEPITDADRRAPRGAELGSDEREVVLHEEHVDVDKRVVPKERVRLEKQTETSEVPVNESIRKERIAVEDDEASRRRK